MSDNPLTADELEKLKLNELKKLCKKNNVSTSGTKLELVARLVENKGGSFTILQPGEEAKLLGDDVDDDESSFSLTDSSALNDLDKPTATSADVTVDTETVSSPAPALKSVSKGAGVKRPSAVLSDSLEENTDNKTDSESTKSATGFTEIRFDSSSPSSESELLAKRANRFGLARPTGSVNLTDEKLVARARRFGLPVVDAGTTNSGEPGSGLRTITGPETQTSEIDEAERLKKRAERFGEVTSKQIEKLNDAERKAMRLERFGPVSATTLSGRSTSTEAELKAARAAKFGIETDEEKLLKRKARFGLA